MRRNSEQGRIAVVELRLRLCGNDGALEDDVPEREADAVAQPRRVVTVTRLAGVAGCRFAG